MAVCAGGVTIAVEYCRFTEIMYVVCIRERMRIILLQIGNYIERRGCQIVATAMAGNACFGSSIYVGNANIGFRQQAWSTGIVLNVTASAGELSNGRITT
jgi:hypothetical protein